MFRRAPRNSIYDGQKNSSKTIKSVVEIIDRKPGDEAAVARIEVMDNQHQNRAMHAGSFTRNLRTTLEWWFRSDCRNGAAQHLEGMAIKFVELMQSVKKRWYRESIICLQKLSRIHVNCLHAS